MAPACLLDRLDDGPGCHNRRKESEVVIDQPSLVEIVEVEELREGED